MSEVSVQLCPSRQLATFMVLAHVLAVAGLCLSSLPAWLCVLVAATVLIHLQRSWHTWFLASAERELRYRNGDWFLLEQRDEQPLTPLGEWLVTSWLVVLQFRRQNGKRLSLVLPPDAAQPDELRRLRVLLRFGLSPQ